MHLLRSARRTLRHLGLAIAAAAMATSCSTSRIPFLGGSGPGDEPATPTTDQRRETLASRAVISQGGEITKVKYYHLDTERRIEAADPSIVFEQRHYLYGAITLEERLARFGHYYTVFWKADDRSTPVTVNFEFRQRDTGPVSVTQSVTIDNIKRNNQTPFQVNGEDYWQRGPVTAWRVTLVQGGNTIAADQSFLWE